VTRRPRKKCQSKRFGATAVEFAIVAPVFLMMMFACMEFIRLNMIRNLVQDAAYFAARDAMVPGATTEEATAAAEQILSYMNTQGAVISINDGAGVQEDSESVTVSITVPFAENSLFIPSFSSELNISSTAEMNTERYSGFYDPD